MYTRRSILTWLFCFFLAGQSFCSEMPQLTLDEIIGMFREERGKLNSYSANYERHEIRKQRSDGSGKPDLEVKTQGISLIDRDGRNFKDSVTTGYTYNHSRKDWVLGEAKNGNLKKVTKTLFLSEDGKSKSGVVSPSNNYACFSYGPERYFSCFLGWPLDEFFDKIRDGIYDIKQTDDYLFTVFWESTEEGLEGVREEFVVDSSKGWNLVKAIGYRKTGELKYDHTMDIVEVDGFFVLKSATLKDFTDQDDPSRLTKSITLSVDIESMRINPVFTDEDFKIDFPPGTYVADGISNLSYKIPNYTSKVYDIGSDPAVQLLAENPLEPTADKQDIDSGSDNPDSANSSTGSARQVQPEKSKITILQSIVALIVVVIVTVAMWAVARRKNK